MGPMDSGTWGHQRQISFHEHGTFFAIWLLVGIASIEILSKARVVLEPLLWAFFIVMGLLPLTDIVENLLLRLCSPCGCKPRRAVLTSSRAVMADDRSESDEGEHTGTGSRGLHSSPAAAGAAGGEQYDHLDSDVRGPSTKPRWENEATETSSSNSEVNEFDEVTSCSKGGFIRFVAVAVVISLSVGFSVLFFGMVYKSALHMQDSWEHYQNGAQNITTRLQALLTHLPTDVVDKLTAKMLINMEEALSELISGLLESTSHAAMEMVWILLYLIFWLCQPVHIGKDVSAVFRRYIFLKGLASAGYSTCIWILLHVLGVDLAVVFGLVTFVFNFIPEVGPFIAMMLPLPVVLFDDRIETPLQYMLAALVGQLALKVVWGNIVEIKLIESQQEMKMHPVVILFFVAFFQYIWGATGMLLSVPIVAALKATLHKLPPAYRNPILVFLEGDKSAPAKWNRWRANLTRADSMNRLGAA